MPHVPARRLSGAACIALALAALPACSSTAEPPGPDGGSDVSRDTVPDTGGDVAPDSIDASDATTDLAGDDGPPPPPVTVRMDFTRTDHFYSAPFPSQELLTPTGPDLSRFPHPADVNLVDQALALLTDVTGFSQAGAIFFHLDGALDPAALPDLAGSLAENSAVLLVEVTPRSPTSGERFPLLIDFSAEGGPHDRPNRLALLPLQGVPLRPNAVYAAVVRRSLGDALGRPLEVAPALAQLLAQEAPAGLEGAALTTYQQALNFLINTVYLPEDDLAALTVFTTGDSAGGMTRFREAVLARPLPVPTAPLAPAEVFDDYCVYETTIMMPVYQAGEPPYSAMGGAWATDAQGAPVLQREEEANLVVTVPRRPIPDTGFPTAVFVRAGGGGERPLVDRGRDIEKHANIAEPGEGPARYFARAGFAGVQVDGPLGGLRNLTMGDEQFLVFNFFNGAALRDNVRQSALELILLAHVLPTLSVDASACPDVTGGTPAGTVTFDARDPADAGGQGTLAIMGHSTGATIAPLAASFEPRYGALLLSGSGGSWIANVIDKVRPLNVRPLAEQLLGYPTGALTAFDPVLTLVQWAAEPADPPVYNRRVVSEPPPGFAPRHVLMMQGIVDHYILPHIAAASSLSLGLDLGGSPLDATNEELMSLGQRPLAPLLPLIDRASVDLPATANRTIGKAPVTAVVTQHAEDGIEDGHEVVFQTATPKHQYQCFLSSWLATGTPTISSGTSITAPCP